MIDFSDNQALKTFAEQLTQSIRVNEKGDILIDSNKINPQCLHLVQKPAPNIPPKEGVDPLKELQKFDKKKLLSKGMKLKDNMKYFLIVNYIERPIQTQQFLAPDRAHEVFEDYESLIEISTNSSSNLKRKIVWEIAEKDAYILTNTKTLREAAKVLIEKIQIIGQRENEEKFLITLNDEGIEKLSFLKEETHNVVFLPEKSLKILQNRIKTRNFYLNYKRYQKEFRSKVILTHGSIKIGKEKFLIYFFEKKPEIHIVMWDLKAFGRSQIEVKYPNYENVLKIKDKKIKKKVINVISNFISISNEGIYYDEKACLETLKKFEIIENKN